jgi:hypothetical protein
MLTKETAMTEATTPRTWVLLDTRPLYTRDSRATVLGVYDLMEEAEAQWKWLSRGVGSHITPDCQRYVILELPLGEAGMAAEVARHDVRRWPKIDH